VANLPYNPIIHDLSYSPRDLTAEEVLDLWFDMFKNYPVEEWNQIADVFDIIPSIQRAFGGVFGYILSIITDLETAVAVGTPFLDLLGVSAEDKSFFIDDYLPLADNLTANISLSQFEKAQLIEDTVGTVLKLLFAFVWQEGTLDLGDIIFTPEANAMGAVLLPEVNSFANNLTSWDLYIEDLQDGSGYPGSAGCNDLIPHAKWHVQAAASLVDVARLLDEVLRLAQGS